MNPVLRVCNKQIHQNIFKFKTLLRAKNIHNIAFSNKKVVLSESGEKYAQIKYTFYKLKQSKSVLLKYVGGQS